MRPPARMHGVIDDPVAERFGLVVEAGASLVDATTRDWGEAAGDDQAGATRAEPRRRRPGAQAGESLSSRPVHGAIRTQLGRVVKPGREARGVRVGALREGSMGRLSPSIMFVRLFQGTGRDAVEVPLGKISSGTPLHGLHPIRIRTPAAQVEHVAPLARPSASAWAGRPGWPWSRGGPVQASGCCGSDDGRSAIAAAGCRLSPRGQAELADDVLRGKRGKARKARYARRYPSPPGPRRGSTAPPAGSGPAAGASRQRRPSVEAQAGQGHQGPGR